MGKTCRPLSREQLGWIKNKTTGIKVTRLSWQQPTKYLGQCFSNFKVPENHLGNLWRCRFGLSSCELGPEILHCKKLPHKALTVNFKPELKNMNQYTMIHKTSSGISPSFVILSKFSAQVVFHCFAFSTANLKFAPAYPPVLFFFFNSLNTILKRKK